MLITLDRLSTSWTEFNANLVLRSRASYQIHIKHWKTTFDCKSPFDSKIACLCQSIEINNNKYVYRQSQVRMPKWQWGQVGWMLADHRDGLLSLSFCLILDSSDGLSAGIQSTGEWVSETLWVRILHSAQEDNLSPFDSKIACLFQSIEINNNKIQPWLILCKTISQSPSRALMGCC